ncbi:hypothetical protein FGO68_gene15887 [Halteria grandinella]|uniref:Uncharacterized protein n=1 Tax=Halteria grandinella TaxID=5974 RepID=A0A8J8NPS7_HALGN|nr:hypothetical protein FGO68_gene15887 [Halteria grandinella]
MTSRQKRALIIRQEYLFQGFKGAQDEEFLFYWHPFFIDSNSFQQDLGETYSKADSYSLHYRVLIQQVWEGLVSLLPRGKVRDKCNFLLIKARVTRRMQYQVV